MSSRTLVNISRTLFNRPVFLTEEWASVLLSAARSELNIDLITTSSGNRFDRFDMDAIASNARAAVDSSRAERDRPRVYDIIDGIAMIPVDGTLTKSWGLDPYSGFTGYDGIKTKLVSAFEDDAVDGVFMDIDSPGGAVSGCFDLVDLMYALRESNTKPIACIANEQACSAAYAIFSAGTPGLRWAPRTGEVGSIGVLQMYTNVEKAMQKQGVDVTIFRAGARKAEGNPYETMSEDAVARVLETLEDMRTMFIDTVARNLTTANADVDALKKTIRETEGLTYIGRHARDIALIDEVGTEDQLWAQLMRSVGR
jgi:signal peptide peptidase SppA